MLHWRLPSNSLHAEELSKRFFGEGPEFDYLNLTNLDGGQPSPKQIDELLNLPAWKTASKMLLPFAPFFSGTDWTRSIVNWRLLYHQPGTSWFIVGDNPIIATGRNDHDPILCLHDIFFPISGNVLLISRGENTPKQLPPEFTVQFGAAMIERCDRFVACRSEEFLAALVDYHSSCEGRGTSSKIIPQLFEMARSS